MGLVDREWPHSFAENWKTDAPRDNSDNHIMFEILSAWFYRSLGGINPDLRIRIQTYNPEAVLS